ncbi:MAG: GerMN domain-containing protein [bacterium]|nr:GerMN domain-containing protein [bacterium]
MKRYQLVLLSFALGIFTATYLGIHFLGKINDIVANFRETSVSVEYKTIQVFLSNKVKDPDTLYCDMTYPVERAVSRLSDNRKSYLGEYTYLALSELLKGPIGSEKENGYFSSINEGTKIQQIIIESGVARVDFSQELSNGVAGSCKVQAIRSQITETLKQFPEIKEVVISVNGESEEILQP